MASLSLPDLWPPRDRLGRKQPHRLALPSFLLSPTIGAAIVEHFDRAIPGEFWFWDIDDEGEHLAVIACPCGEEPGVSPIRMTECECGRYYLNLVTEVRVWKPEEVEAGLPEADRRHA